MIRALAVLCALAAPAAADVVRVEHFDPSVPPARGPATAPVTIELFFVPNSNAAARLPIYRALEQLQAAHPTRIRLVYRILRRSAPRLATAAYEAYAEGKLAAFMEELSGRTRQVGNDDLVDIARAAGLDLARLAEAIRAGWYASALDANERRVDRLRVAMPPAALFNGVALRGSLSSISADQLAAAYQNAYDRALDKLDRGVAPADLTAAFDDDALQRPQPLVISGNDSDGSPLDHPLASPPLRLAGLPTYGSIDAPGPQPIVVLCRPTDTQCTRTLRGLEPVASRDADGVRIVWAPWFDVLHDDAPDQALLADAALCAEDIGTGDETDRMRSAGWTWVKAMYDQIDRTRMKHPSADKLIDQVQQKLDLDRRALSACRARMAGTSLAWIAAARHAGISRANAVVVGGRIYEGTQDPSVIQQLVEAELAPGVLGTVAPGRRPTR